MAGKKAAMTPAEIKAAGFVIEEYVPIGSGERTRKHPWVIRRISSGETMAGRVATREESIAILQEELASPDSTWR